MRKLLLGMSGLAALAMASAPAQAQNQPPIKVGLIMSYSGQFADLGTMMDNGIKLYMKQHGDTVAGRKIEIIRRDSGAAGTAPDVARRLAQELIVRDRVDIIAGFSLTPDALAAADVLTQAKKPGVITNAATAIITARSPYLVRTSIALPQAMGALGTWAAKNGTKNAFTMVTDYGPGIDSEQEFQLQFKQGGGTINGSVRFPVANPDFSAFAQRLKDSNSEAVFVFVPGGEQPAALAKAFAEHGVNPKSMKILSSGELVNDEALKSMGDAAVGMISGWHYDHNLKTRMNPEFVKGMNELLGGRNPDQFAVTAYDGMHLIYEAIKKTGGKTDGDALIAAMKGVSFESPRGSVTIDPETRDIIQTIYLRRVERVDGRLVNVEFDKIDNVKDPVKERLKAEGKLTADGLAK
ncbi:MAG TPA: ABC transporter substrate-binding protein [Xanthobacteraceae bacterium]|nr:ABC transporter substrate-binding protein [Xanthobacteraceae bacterium]